jgi:hypothetical protein
MTIEGSALSQQAGTIPRIGVLISASSPHRLTDTLGRGLQDLGYAEGRNIALKVRYTEGPRTCRRTRASVAASGVDCLPFLTRQPVAKC